MIAMKTDYSQYYSELLYNLIPEIYRKKDFDKKELASFLKIIGEQAGVLRQNMDDLWYDFFIETCHDWVIPYIGDLLGTNLIFNDVARNKVDVRNTIPWRRRKGTLAGLEDIAKGITGWNAHAVELFNLLTWSQNVNHVKLDKLFTPDLKNIFLLEKLNSAYDTVPHTADIRNPSQHQGWYNIKNIGFFLFTKQMYRLDHTTPMDATSRHGGYTFSSTGKNVQLFDLETRDTIKPLDFHKNHDEYFCMDRGMSIYCDGVPMASTILPPPLPVSSQTFCTIRKLHDEHGMRLIEWSCQSGEFKIEAIDAEWKEEKYIANRIWGTLQTSSKNYSKGEENGPEKGTFMLKISLVSDTGTAFFPGGILALRDIEKSEEVTAKNTIESIYNNALYVYLPEAFLDEEGELYLFVDDVGATYYANGTSELSVNNLARASEGQVYPPRNLSSSLKPLKLDSINRENGISLFDRERFKNKSFTITCCNVDFTYAQTEPSITELGSLKIDGSSEPKYTHLTTVQAGKGLALKIKHESGSRFPQSEVVLKDTRGRGTLIYLPEINFSTKEDEVYLYPADDGSTYYTSTKYTGKPTLKPDRDEAFRTSIIARKSAGQVLPIPNVFPLQQRQVEYSNLCCWKDPSVGKIAIDPVLGRFCFPSSEVPEGRITVRYNEAFTYDIGARTYDRRDVLLTPLIRVRGSDSSDNGTYKTLAEAINNAPEDGIIQIEDSLTYKESNLLKINKPLTIQAANFQRPTIEVNRIEVEGRVEDLRLNGIFFTSGISLKTSISRLIISNCTFNPDNECLKVPYNAAEYNDVSVDSVEISNSIIGRIALRNVGNLKITDSIVHDKSSTATAICGNKIDENSDVILTIERSTILGDCKAKELYSSDSIYLGIINVINTQEGCIRYCRYQKEGSRLPAVFDSIEDLPLFNSLSFWKHDYCELAVNCSEDVKTKSENGSEMGAFSGAQNPIREKNLRVKLKEYMPAGLKPVIIYEFQED